MPHTLIIFAGPNGSGKSTIVAQVLKKLPRLRYICPDNYIGKYKHMESVEEQYVYAMKAAETDRLTAIKHRLPFAVETVFSTASKLDFIRFAQGHNYKVTVIFVTTSDHRINIDRVRQRVIQGGHDVPEEKVIDRYDRSMDLLPEIILTADEVMVYDNSVSDGTPELVFLKSNEQYLAFHKTKRPEWADRLVHDLSGKIKIDEVTTEHEQG